MSSSDSGFNDNAKNYGDDATSSDGYGGMSPMIYDAIVAFKKDPTAYPSFCDLRENRNAHFHWRCRCKNFSITESGVLLYSGNNASAPRAVVRVGETRLAIKFIHEKMGHALQKQTGVMCSRRLYWRSMRRDVARFIAECEFCRKKKEIRRNDLQLSHIGATPSVHSSLSEEAEMRAVADRLLLNADDTETAEQYYRGPEDLTYEVYEDDGSFQRVLEGMEGELLAVGEGDETEVATTLTGMSVGTYIVVQQQPQPRLKLDEDDSRSTVGGGEYADDEEEDVMPMIVPADVIPAGSNEIVRTMSEGGKSPPPKLEQQEPMPQMQQSHGSQLQLLEGEGEELVEGNGEGDECSSQRGVKRRLLDPSLMPSPAALGIPLHLGGNKTKKRLLEENQALRSRLVVLESLNSEERAGALASVAMQMAPIDEETAEMQKSLLIMQREVLMLQRTYWQAKLQHEGFDMQLSHLYAQEEEDEDAAAAAAAEAAGMGGETHYEEMDEEEVERHRAMQEEEERRAMGNVH